MTLYLVFESRPVEDHERVIILDSHAEYFRLHRTAIYRADWIVVRGTDFAPPRVIKDKVSRGQRH